MNLNPLEWFRRSFPPQPVTWETVFGSKTQLAGISVSEYSALHYSPVWAGVSTLSRDIAKLPLVFYKNLPNGGKERFTTHRLYRILHDEPNPEMTSFKFRETMQALCILYGNAYAEIVRDALGKPAGMYPILPSRVTPFRLDNGQLRYRVSNPNGSQSILQPANMIHLSSLSTDGIIGHGLVEHAAESIALGIATEKFGSSFFGQGATFGGILEVPGDLKQPAKDAMRTMIEAVHQGVERAHRILVIANGAKFTQRGTAPNDAQFIETRKFQINETARWLGMPPHKLGDLENAHFTNIEEQELQYYVGCVSGWLKMWEQELTRKLVSPLEYSQQTIEHVLEGVLRGDSTKRADYYGKMHSIGVFSINDILRLENMNPIGSAGDVHLVPLNMVPAERYEEYFEKKLLAAEEPKQLPEPKKEPDPAVEEAARTAREAIEARDAAMRTAAEHEGKVHAAQTEVATRARELDEARAAIAEQARVGAEHATRADVAGTERDLAVLEVQAAKLELASKQEALDAAQHILETVQAEARAMEARVVEAESRAQERAKELEQAVACAADAAARAVAAEHAAAAERTAATAATADAAAAWIAAAERAERLAATEATLAEVRTTLDEAQRAAADEAAKAAAAAQAVEAVRAEAEAATAAVAERAAQLVAADAALSEVRSALTTTERTVAERRAAELNRLTNVVAAHRALIVHAVQRLLRPEVDRARRRQGTPDQLRKWVDAFYVTHREVCADEFYPAVLTHLAWKRSEEDPRTVARAMAEAHCAYSERELLAVLDGTDDGHDLHATLERVLIRWEQERPQIAADGLLKDEIAYIGSFQ